MTMHMRPLSWLLVATTVATSTACATVTRPHMNRVTVASDPPLAAIMADGEPVGDTPVTVPLSRHGWWGRGRGGAVLRFEKDGFVPSEVWIERRVNRWVFGNFVLAAIAGGLAAADPDSSGDRGPGRVAAATLLWSVGIDFLSGSLFAFPRTVHTTLAPAAAVHRGPTYGAVTAWRNPMAGPRHSSRWAQNARCGKDARCRRDVSRRCRR